ncbi:hypothetical protein KI387_002007, partial [Taxus chinensis]
MAWICRLRCAGRSLSARTLIRRGGVFGLGLGWMWMSNVEDGYAHDLMRRVKIAGAVPLRLSRNALTAAIIAFDYEYSLWGLPEGSIERTKAKHEVHLRCANRLQELCFRNGGIYIKLGQHIGQL